jgi:ComF family protein
LFPDECRVCGQPLQDFSKIPVCSGCLKDPSPLLADHFCVVCHTPFLNSAPLDEQGRCGLCRAGANGFDAAFAFGEYGGTLRKLIHLFKYTRMKPLAAPLGKMLNAALPRDRAFDVIVPMPLHWRRRWDRGFNQAELLARAVSQRSGMPVREVLKRSRATPAQAGLTNSERRRNVTGTFEVSRVDRRHVEGRHVLLIDDVFTTGATASSAAAALKRAGAARITVLTLARADRRKGFIQALD